MKRIVIKVGTAVLTQGDSLSFERLDNLVDFIAKLKKEKNYEIILVSSGAVGAGHIKLKLDRTILENKQALASIGQPLLMKHYKTRFEKHDLLCSQMLFTADDFDSRKRSKKAFDVMEVLLKNDVIPIINENDVIANYELKIGDNDQLGAHAAYYFKADLLVVLSDIDGYYNKNPREFKDAIMLKEVNNIDSSELETEFTPNSKFATGGIVTKLKAADFLMKKDLKMYLTSGFDLKDAKEFLLNNKQINGTIFKR